MLTVKNFQTYGWEACIRGLRNPMNSWSKSDSTPTAIGPNDLSLMQKLRNGGSDDRKFMRQIFVSCDITAPLYWWKEMDQYKVGTVTNSCSTMHKIAEKEFTMEDFSCEHLMDLWMDTTNEIPSINVCPTGQCENMYDPVGIMELTIEMLNLCRERYLNTKDKTYWWQMIQLLPSSYNQKRTWTGNYEVLCNIWHARHNHKLDEWQIFCGEIERLPYAKELIIGG